MGLSKCYNAIKYVVILANLIFWMIGASAVILSIWMLADQTFLLTLSQDQPNYYAGLYILLAAGSLMFIISFLGCYGVYKNSQCMLVTFCSCMLIVIVAQVAVGTWLYVNSERLEELVRSSVHSSIENEYGTIESRKKVVDSFQQNLQCCGANSPNDWAANKILNSGGKPEIFLAVSKDTTFTVPKSCCREEDSVECRRLTAIHYADKSFPPAIFDKGCTDQILTELRRQGSAFLGVIIGLGVLELLGLTFSLIHCCTIGSDDRYKA